MKKRPIILNNTYLIDYPGGVRISMWKNNYNKRLVPFTGYAWKSITSMKNFYYYEKTLKQKELILSIDKFQELYD